MLLLSLCCVALSATTGLSNPGQQQASNHHRILNDFHAAYAGGPVTRGDKYFMRSMLATEPAEGQAGYHGNYRSVEDDAGGFRFSRGFKRSVREHSVVTRQQNLEIFSLFLSSSSALARVARRLPITVRLTASTSGRPPPSWSRPGSMEAPSSSAQHLAAQRPGSGGSRTECPSRR